VQILGFQAAFKSSFQQPYFRALSSIPSIDPDINRTISYWFEGEDLRSKWFMGGAKIDAEIKTQFGDLVEKARASQLSTWAQQPQGALALIVLLDQFPRNIFRGSPLSYSSDSMAVEVATEAIAKGFDREVTHLQQPFFYLPLMHSENLLSQVAALALYENLCYRCEPDSMPKEYAESSTKYSSLHRDVIMRFGRFPSRNEALGRISTPEEIQYLKEHPSGF
jgi:uncharacterized protein (DUF924 family)